jgi:hypothetical protein
MDTNYHLLRDLEYERELSDWYVRVSSSAKHIVADIHLKEMKSAQFYELLSSHDESLLQAAVVLGKEALSNNLLDSTFKPTLDETMITKWTVCGHCTKWSSPETEKNVIHELFDILMASGSLENLNTVSTNGCTPLIYAMEWSQMATFTILIHHPRIDLNACGRYKSTPLLCVARWGYFQTCPFVERLLTVGYRKLDYNLRDEEKLTALETIVDGLKTNYQKEAKQYIHDAIQTAMTLSQLSDILERQIFISWPPSLAVSCIMPYLIDFGSLPQFRFFAAKIKNQA